MATDERKKKLLAEQQTNENIRQASDTAPQIQLPTSQPGSTYTPTTTTGQGSAANGGQWYGMAEDIWNQYQTRPNFQFDVNASGLYNIYKDQAIRNGQLAMRDTIGQTAGLTGGYANSYAQGAGQQAYNRYLDQLNAQVPEIYAQERAAWQQQGDDMLNRMQILNQMGDRAYQQGRDQIADDRYAQEWAYQQSRDQVADARYDRENAASMAMQLINIGKMPTDAQLAAAGMDKDAALALSQWYANQLANAGVGSGGGGGRYYNTNPGSNPPATDPTTTETSPKDALWAQMSQSTQSRILAWINGHPGRVSAATLDDAFGAGTVERQYMALVYGV